MIGMAVSAGLNLASTIANNIATQKQRKDTLAAYDKYTRSLNTDIYGDPTKRADVNRLLTKQQEQYKEHRQQAIQRENLGFQPHDATVAQAEADSKGMADTIGNIYAQNAQRVDAAKEKQRENIMQRDLYAAQNDTNTAAQQLINNSANIGSALETAFGGKTAGATKQL